jgi:glutathione S-transferase
MLKIWGRATSFNVQKVMWAVSELGLEHSRVDVGGEFGGNDTPEYLAMNPNGLVPVVQDGDLTLWESHTCVRYISARYGMGRLCPEDLAERASAERWMDWYQSRVHADWGIMFAGLVRTPPSKRDMACIDAAVQRLGTSLQILEQHLAGREYIAGDELTIADIPLGASLFRYYELRVERPSMPNIDAWYQRLQARVSYVEHAMVSFEGLRATD